jgi:hypothetical protein
MQTLDRISKLPARCPPPGPFRENPPDSTVVVSRRGGIASPIESPIPPLAGVPRAGAARRLQGGEPNGAANRSRCTGIDLMPFRLSWPFQRMLKVTIIMKEIDDSTISL